MKLEINGNEITSKSQKLLYSIIAVSILIFAVLFATGVVISSVTFAVFLLLSICTIALLIYPFAKTQIE